MPHILNVKHRGPLHQCRETQTTNHWKPISVNIILNSTHSKHLNTPVHTYLHSFKNTHL